MNTKFVSSLIRKASTKPTTNGDIQPFITNRNPRNLEKLRLQKKPMGYFLEKERFKYWHRLKINQLKKGVVAELVHNSQKVVIQASTNEWSIRKFLYSPVDKQAYCILGQVFAERCLESGFVNIHNEIPIKKDEDTKVQLFLRVLMNEGIVLNELPVFNVYDIWYKTPEKKPWTVLEDSQTNKAG